LFRLMQPHRIDREKSVSQQTRISTPLTDQVVHSLKAGERVLICGTIYGARDMAHKRLCQAISKGEPLPFELSGAVIYFVGPTPARQSRVIGAAGPTTSSRMDPFSPVLFEHGLKATLGKGTRGSEVVEALRKYGAVHLAAVGGAAALLSGRITAAEVIAYEDLQAEAVRKLQVVDFPAIVAYDCKGNSIYDRLGASR